MTRRDDDKDVDAKMQETAEEQAMLAELRDAVRPFVDAAPPPPTARLAEVLRSGIPRPDVHRGLQPRARARRWRAAAVRLGGAGLGAKLVLGAGVAAASTVGVAAVEGPDGPVHRGVTYVTSAVTGLVDGGDARPQRPQPVTTDDVRGTDEREAGVRETGVRAPDVHGPPASVPAQLPAPAARQTPPAAAPADRPGAVPSARDEAPPARPAADPPRPAAPAQAPSPQATGSQQPPGPSVRDEKSPSAGPGQTTPPAPPVESEPARPAAPADSGRTPPIGGTG